MICCEFCTFVLYCVCSGFCRDNRCLEFCLIVKWLKASEELLPKKKGTLKMVTEECLVLGLTCHRSTTIFSEVCRFWKEFRYCRFLRFQSDHSFLTHGSTQVNPWTQKLSDCSFSQQQFCNYLCGWAGVSLSLQTSK